MQERFYNGPAVNWAKQNLPQAIEVKLLLGKRWQRWLIYALLFSIPLLIIACLVFLKITGDPQTGWGGIFLCGGVLMFPAIVLVLIGIVTRQTLVRSIDVNGVRSSTGRTFLWENLYFIDHVSKTFRSGGVSRKIEDNQLELVFADGKAIIPPLIRDRDQMWSLINSCPAEVRFDGKVRTHAQETSSVGDELMNFLNELPPQQ